MCRGACGRAGRTSKAGKVSPDRADRVNDGGSPRIGEVPIRDRPDHAIFVEGDASVSLAPTSAALLSGVIASLAAFVVFLAVHHFWIRPIWMIALPGSLIAIVGGLAVGWAYSLVRESLPGSPWTAPAVLAGMIAILAPAVALSYTHGPLFDLSTATIPAGEGRAVAIRAVLELLLTATLVGAIAGAWLGRSAMASFAVALAGLALAVGPGHNIPMFGTAAPGLKGHAIVLVVATVVAFTLVHVEAALRRTGGS